MAATIADFGTREQFAAYQAKRRQELWGLLGDLPARRPATARARC